MNKFEKLSDSWKFVSIMLNVSLNISLRVVRNLSDCKMLMVAALSYFWQFLKISFDTVVRRAVFISNLDVISVAFAHILKGNSLFVFVRVYQFLSCSFQLTHNTNQWKCHTIHWEIFRGDTKCDLQVTIRFSQLLHYNLFFSFCSLSESISSFILKNFELWVAADSPGISPFFLHSCPSFIPSFLSGHNSFIWKVCCYLLSPKVSLGIISCRRHYLGSISLSCLCITNCFAKQRLCEALVETMWNFVECWLVTCILFCDFL